ncbi:SRPBCC family protein [Leptospira interrogans]|uniref:SRPBCC family protein n=1 Tax=Leptospira interrogans TaxID=173 RepID=UPI0010C09F3F|nr:SRPBCC family protein [Leptospira interrogans]KAA1268746.1 ATPase [Leptospira interrogans serovar Weerasinghe]KAA1290794.1 ATPase [Leptospira interrogans serovar Geyaweera]QCO38869.1 ATPase [Leptospira interrogans]ULG81323.1 SRPBCC family protein [Leptospira interrogans]UML68944.1 SRPBCC family protein [Leptospira interrogans]
MIKNYAETIVESNKVIYKRYLDVPVNLAFEVWSSQEHLSQWWGPEGFTLTIKSMDFSNGGVWDFIMHGPDGHDYKNKIQFIDISKPNYIYYKHLGDGEGAKDVDFQSRVMFEQAGEGTNLTVEQIFSSKEELERINKKYGAIEGAKQHIAKFSKYLETLNRS